MVNSNVKFTNDVGLVFQFWVLTLILLTFSTTANTIYWGMNITDSLGRFIPFVLAPSLVFSLYWMASNERLVFALLTSFVVASFFIGLIYCYFVLTNSLDYYTDYRFVGYSDNPNQIASQALATIVIGILYATYFTGISIPLKIINFLMIGFAFIYGVACVSSTFYLATVFLLGGLAAFYYIKLLLRFPAPILFASFVAIIVLSYYSTSLLENSGLVLKLFNDVKTGTDDHDIVRVLLWENGFAAGMASPIIGNGAGAWSGFTGPFGGVESHNSFIDWFSIVGGLGLLILLQMMLRFVLHVRWPRLEPLICFMALILLSVFHFVLRHPFFWLAVFVCFYTNTRIKKTISRPHHIVSEKREFAWK